LDQIKASDLECMGDPLIVCTFGRSGTHLLMDMVRCQFPAFASWKLPGRSVAELFLPLEEFVQGHIKVRRVRKMLARGRMIVRSHSWPNVISEVARAQPAFAQWLQAHAKIIFVARDPVVAIPKLWTLSSQFRERMDIAPLEDQDAFLAEQATRWSALAEAALDTPRAEIILLEQLLADPRAQIAKMARMLRETPRYAQPLLVAPNRHRFDTIFARLHPKPRSTHVLLQARARARYQFIWTPERLATLDSRAGAIMARLGYERLMPLEATTMVARTVLRAVP